MDVEKFSEALVRLNTKIALYLQAKKARELASEVHGPLGREVMNTILDVLGEKISGYEKEIIELATKLTQAGQG